MFEISVHGTVICVCVCVCVVFGGDELGYWPVATLLKKALGNRFLLADVDAQEEPDCHL